MKIMQSCAALWLACLQGGFYENVPLSHYHKVHNRVTSVVCNDANNYRILVWYYFAVIPQSLLSLGWASVTVYESSFVLIALLCIRIFLWIGNDGHACVRTYQMLIWWEFFVYVLSKNMLNKKIFLLVILNKIIFFL